MEVSMIGLDIAKKKMYLIGAGGRGEVFYKKCLNASELLLFLSNHKPCVVVMEACGGSSYWGRQIREMGHAVKLVNPFKVARIRTKQKNDYNDCLAIIELAQRKDTKYIGINEIWQQDLQSLHRIRRRTVKARVDLMNQIHGLCLEYGVALPQGKKGFKEALTLAIESAENELSPLMRRHLSLLQSQLKDLESQQGALDKEVELLAEKREDTQRLMQVPGVGALTATAFVAAVGDPSLFKNGREASAWLGLVPRQYTTGGKVKLGRITKKGDTYLRQLLVHGGRSVIISLRRKSSQGGFSKKVLRIANEQGFKKAAVAVANRNARVMLMMLKEQTEYRV